MAMGTKRSSKALHNFTMPGELRWGSQKYLRCMKVNSDGQIAPLRRFATVDSDSSDQRRRENPVQHRRAGVDGERRRERGASFELMHGSHELGRTPPPASGGGREFSDGDVGIAAVREKLMLDLQTAADRMKDAIFKDGFEEGAVSDSPRPPLPEVAAPLVDGEIHRPWNLRTRRAACKTPASRSVSSLNADTTAAGGENNCAGDGKTMTVDALKSNSGFSQMRAAEPEAAANNWIRLRSGGCGTAAICEKRERPKFAVALSETEIEEDLFAIVGRRPARRPKKRARIVQRRLDTLFPGLWMKEVTPDMYKVSEAAP